MTTYRNISTHIKNEEIEIAESKQTELLEIVFNKILENEADKLEKSSQFSIKQFSNFTNELAKAFGTDTDKIVAILPEIFEKLNVDKNNQIDKKIVSTDEEINDKEDKTNS